MALNRKPSTEPAATLRAVAPAETATPRNSWTGRVGALSALARLAAFRHGVRFLTYAVLGALIGVLLLVASATLPVLFGYHNYVVHGGSMGASLKAGSAAVTKPTSPYDLRIGDIIARRESEDSPPVLHRIVDIKVESGQRLFTTQGDVNRTPDPQPVALDGPGDKVILSIPYAGYILDFAGTLLGRLLLIGAPLALLATIVIRDRRGSGSGDTGDTAGSEETAPSLPGAAPTATADEEQREAASVLLTPRKSTGRAALLLILLPLALSFGFALTAGGRPAAGTESGGV